MKLVTVGLFLNYTYPESGFGEECFEADWVINYFIGDLIRGGIFWFVDEDARFELDVLCLNKYDRSG